ncbi:MAG: hypothetical protein RLZZ546_2565 [Bacteroidota bacterium]|jgi:hypothetical protein
MINYDDLKVGSQIIFYSPILNENAPIAGVCISKNDEDADFLCELGSLYLRKDTFEETVNSFRIESIDETHEKWQQVDNKVFKFFSKLDELEQKQKNGETEGDELDFLDLLEGLGDEFDKDFFKE